MNMRHFKNTTQDLSLEDIFRILQYPPSLLKDVHKFFDYIYKAGNKEVLIINEGCSILTTRSGRESRIIKCDKRLNIAIVTAKHVDLEKFCLYSGL